MKRLTAFIHAALLLGITVLLLLQASYVRNFDAEKPNRVFHLIEDLSQLDTQSEQNMLQIYSRSMFDYDTLARDVAKMEEVFSDLSAEIGDDEMFRKELEALKASIVIQQEGAGTFKSAFGILANSIRYLPTLVTQLQKERPELIVWLAELNRDIYQWQLYPDNRAVHDRIVLSATKLESLGLTQLSRHVELILEYGVYVEDAMAEVIGCGTAENAHLLSVAYERHFTARVHEDQNNKMMLIILGGLLLVYLLLLLFFRQRDAVRLSESEKRFHLLFDLIPDGVGVHSDGRWVYCNPAAVRMFGAKNASALIGTPVIDRVHPEMHEEVLGRIRQEEKLQPAPLMLQKNLRMDGSQFFGEVEGIPFIEGDRPVTMTVIRDVSERVEAERRSRQLTAAVEHTAESIVITDLQSMIQYANPAFEKLTGYGRGETTGCDFRLFRDEGINAEVYETIMKKVEDGHPWIGELPLRVKSGDVILAERSIAPIRDGAGIIVNYVTAMRDITEEKLRSQQMEHTQRLESMGILAGGIAHDFNNILTAVMGNAAMAVRNLDDSSPARDFISRIEFSAHRASDLCKQMLAYSGKGKFAIKPINLSKLVEEMARLMEVSIEKDVGIRYHLTDDLPAVEADAAQLQQVILNLITNANEAIGEASGVISFATGVMHADKAYLSQTYTKDDLPAGHYVFIEVSDSGCGMDAEVMNKIFDPFFTTKFTGRGLGMSAVLGIVRGHQGALRVHSEPGKGTTFKVLLPASNQVALPDVGDEGESGNWRASGTMLVVDDEETIREVASMMLEDMGFKTLSANDGVEALELYRQHENEIVAVLLDMTMPRMDGKECFSELRRISPDVKVILSSGYNEQDATSRFVGQGLAGFIQKPYSSDLLIEKLRAMIDGR